MKSIVGYTGFVGSNICRSVNFDNFYDKDNIKEAYNTNPDLLVYAGVPAEVFYANKYPEKDMDIIVQAEENIKKINPKKIVLISSVNVYPNDKQGDEDFEVNLDELEPYGKNRLLLEKWVKDNYVDYLIIRLPGLFGRNIKKNFIYDLIHLIPSKLTENKIKELANKSDKILKYYTNNNDGFYICNQLEKEDKKELINILDELEFNALNFTDSRGIYQYFYLKYLGDIINKALDNKIKVLNIATEPFTISELYYKLYGKEFINILNKPVTKYNMKTKYDKIFGGENGYIYKKETVIKEIKEFVGEERENIGI